MENKTIHILYEDKHILAVNKPAGLMVHPDGKTKERALTDWISEHYPKIKNVGEAAVYNGKKIIRPGIVHRLDKDTSGVLVIAKDQDTFLRLKEQFQERSVKKTYRAFVYGKVKEDKGTIDRPIGRSAKDFRLYSAQRGAKGALREAVTEYNVLSRLTKDQAFDNTAGESFSYLELYPKTGRTHQLRVHLKAINHPIICDKLYAPARALRAGGSKRECALGFDRLALHAFSIDIALPDGSRKIIEAPLPEDFERAVAELS